MPQDKFQVELRGTEATLEWIQEHLGQKEACMVYIESIEAFFYEGVWERVLWRGIWDQEKFLLRIRGTRADWSDPAETKS